MSNYRNDENTDFPVSDVKRSVKITASIPLSLHVVAKRMYAIQGKKMGDRVEDLLRGDLKRMLKTEMFKKMPDTDIALFKAFIDMKDIYPSGICSQDEEGN
ncbi:MAG: hypothetical protein K2X08_04230 [Chlamydiales bacterium]|nr:hypothetical protein [Chlamydiales bacterium]